MPSSGGQTCARSADRKSTRLNSSHTIISYAVFCLETTPEPLRRLCSRGGDRAACPGGVAALLAARARVAGGALGTFDRVFLARYHFVFFLRERAPTEFLRFPQAAALLG